MPRTGGSYSLPPSYKATSGQTIRTEQHNPPLEDIAQALTGSLPRDGSAPMTGSLPMNGQRVTNLGAGTAASDAVRRDQVTLYSAYLSSVAGLALEANTIPYATAAGAAAKTALTAFARTMLDDADAATARATLELKAGATAEKATTAEAETGTNDAKYMTPKTTKEAVEEHTIYAAGAVGSFALALHTTDNFPVAFGETVSGLTLRPTSSNASGASAIGSTLTGTWRCMGQKGSGSDNETNITLWHRIS